jgi:hypothetical protein
MMVARVQYPDGAGLEIEALPVQRISMRTATDSCCSSWSPVVSPEPVPAAEPLSTGPDANSSSQLEGGK